MTQLEHSIELDDVHDSADRPPESGRFIAGQRIAAPSLVIISHPNRACCEALARNLLPGLITLKICDSTKALRQALHDCPPAIIITELRLSDGPTMRIIKRVRREHPETRVVVVTAYGSVASAVSCSRLGVQGYYTEHELSPGNANGPAIGNSTYSGAPEPLRLDRAVWEYLNRVVEHSGSISRGAAVLGLDRRSLRRMLSKHAPAP